MQEPVLWEEFLVNTAMAAAAVEHALVMILGAADAVDHSWKG